LVGDVHDLVHDALPAALDDGREAVGVAPDDLDRSAVARQVVYGAREGGFTRHGIVRARILIEPSAVRRAVRGLVLDALARLALHRIGSAAANVADLQSATGDTVPVAPGLRADLDLVHRAPVARRERVANEARARLHAPGGREEQRENGEREHLVSHGITRLTRGSDRGAVRGRAVRTSLACAMAMRQPWIARTPR
jgi:hypothetical protein